MPSAAIDTIVHSVCKLLGHLGSHPEYGKGVRGFPEYLKELLEEVEAVGDNARRERRTESHIVCQVISTSR